MTAAEGHDSITAGDAHLLGVRAAARELKLNPSTISRQIAAGIIPNRGTADAPMVNPAEARAARAAHVDRSKQRGPNAPLFAGEVPAAAPRPVEPVEDPDTDDDETASPATPPSDRLSYNTARTARESYQAKLAQLEYEERIGRLVPKSEVELEAFDAARLLRDRILAAPGQLATMTEEREIAALLRDELRRALTEASHDVNADPELADDDGGEGAV